MENDETLFEEIKDLLNKQLFGVLATQGVKYPYTSLIAYSTSADYKKLFFFTARNTRKYDNLCSHNHISMMISSASNSDHDLMQAKALTVLGRAEELKKTSSVFKKDFLEKHPYLEKFANAPSTVLFEIRVEKYILVSHFQKVMEYTVNE